VERTRRTVTLAVLIGALGPPALAYLGYVAAGSPNVDCGDSESTEAFYRVALPFFGLAGLVGAAAIVVIARTRTEAKRHWLAGCVAVLAGLAALDGFLPGGLHTPAGFLVVVLGVAALFAGVVTGPLTVALALMAGTTLYRGRLRGAPDIKERRLYLLLVGWVLLAPLPALILGVSLNADPLCFTF
jgi:hypothetical protein